MTTTLNHEDIDFLIEALGYTKLKFESTEYPTCELRRVQIDKVESLLEKLRKMKKEKKE